jgi:hypothetical protein
MFPKLFRHPFSVAFPKSNLAIEDVRSDSCIAALSVIESLTSRLCEISQYDDSFDNEAGIDISLEAAYIKRTEELKRKLDEYLSKIEARIANLLVLCASTNKKTRPRLGLKGLLTIKLVEALVRMNCYELDSKLAKTTVLRNSMSLMLIYESNSLLHLSVQRMICGIIDGVRRWFVDFIPKYNGLYYFQLAFMIL